MLDFKIDIWITQPNNEEDYRVYHFDDISDLSKVEQKSVKIILFSFILGIITRIGAVIRIIVLASILGNVSY